jgi:hypothetical protein
MISFSTFLFFCSERTMRAFYWRMCEKGIDVYGDGLWSRRGHGMTSRFFVFMLILELEIDQLVIS